MWFKLFRYMYRGMNLLHDVMFITIMNLQNIELVKKVNLVSENVVQESSS